MLTLDELRALVQDLEHSGVLTVYLSREASDPGRVGLWRNRLDAALSEAASTAADWNAVTAAAGHVVAATASFGRVLPYPGWCAFATGDRLCHAGSLPFAPRTLARWGLGPYLAPYIRALKSERPVVVGLIDNRTARIFVYRDGALEPTSEMSVEGADLEPADVGMSKRAASATGTSGVRGETRTDAAGLALREVQRRLQARLAEALVTRAGDVGLVLVGGSKKPEAAVYREVAARVPGRVGRLEGVPERVGDETLLRSVEAAASLLTLHRQEELLRQVYEGAGRASIGWNDTRRALDSGAVDTLLLSRDLIESAPDDADELVRMAVLQRAEVEELGGDLGLRLRQDAGGVGARLRFRPS